MRVQGMLLIRRLGGKHMKRPEGFPLWLWRANWTIWWLVIVGVAYATVQLLKG